MKYENPLCLCSNHTTKRLFSSRISGDIPTVKRIATDGVFRQIAWDAVYSIVTVSGTRFHPRTPMEGLDSPAGNAIVTVRSSPGNSET